MSKIIPINMPDLGEGVVEGEIQKWYVKEGDSVKEDQPLVEVMTDKASMEIPSMTSGEVIEIKVKEGEVCEVGKPLLIVQGSEEKVKTSVASKPTSLTFKDEIPKQKTPNSKSTSSILAAPKIRKLAKKHSIDLSTVQGTGLSGRIRLKDVEALIQKSPAPNLTHSGFAVPVLGEEKREPLKGVRKKIASNMQASKRVIPHFTVVDEALFDNLYKVRMEAKELNPSSKITYLSFIMKILYHCLLDFPQINASIDDTTEEIVYKKYYNFGFATDTPRGLLVPVIKDVDQKNIIRISQEIRSLSDQAREGSIKMDDMKGATITITNMGSIAGEWATPIINPPEVAILGMYKMSVKPRWNGKEWKPCRMMNFSITSDHRLIDGALAARFIQQFVERVENPNLILLEG